MRKSIFAALAAAALSGCSDAPAPLTPLPVDVPPAMLRDIIVDDLPSPYYHFEYDADGRTTVAAFASGLVNFDVSYEQGRIRRLTNNTPSDHRKLEYAYDALGRVASIEMILDDGSKEMTLQFTWAGARLTRVDRYRRLPQGMVLNKTVTLTYAADGNLADLVEVFPEVAGQQVAATSSYHFENYDSKVNVDGFTWLQTGFFDPLILLPGVQMQRGNPARVTRGGDGVHYTTDYTYTYDDKGRPLTRTGDVAFTSGTSAGQHFVEHTQYSYYQVP